MRWRRALVCSVSFTQQLFDAATILSIAMLAGKFSHLFAVAQSDARHVLVLSVLLHIIDSHASTLTESKVGASVGDDIPRILAEIGIVVVASDA